MIKFKFLVPLFTLMIGVLITGCEKESVFENDFQTEERIQRAAIEMGDGVVDPSEALTYIDQIPYRSISIDRSLNALRFASEDAASQTLTLLEQAEDALLTEIQTSVSGFSETEVDRMNINPSLTNEAFEAKIGFSSLRAMVVSLEEKFLQNETLDDRNDPTDQYAYAGPEFFRAVLSPNAEIIVAGAISKLMPDGGNYTITDGDLGTLNFLRNNPSVKQINQVPNIQIIDYPTLSSGTSNCVQNKIVSDTKYKTVDGKKYRTKFLLEIKNNSFPWFFGRYVKAELKSYKKQWLFWKKYPTYINIAISKNVYKSAATGDCDGKAVAINKNGDTIDAYLKVKKNKFYKISASDKDGAAGILQGTYHWLGETFVLTMF